MKPKDGAPDARSLWASALQLFWAISFGWAGGLWIAGVALAPRAPGWSNAVLILAGFGPSLAEFLAVLTFEGGDGLRRWLRRCMVWRLGTGWYLLALGAPLALLLAAVGADGALTGVWPPSPAIGRIGRGLLQFGLILVLGGPGGEEFGWRGHALAALTGRFGWRWASLGLCAVWGLWHLPLFDLPGMAQMPMALFMASSVALSVIVARMTVTTGFSILLALMFHWAINGWPSFVPIIPVEDNVRPCVLAMVFLFLAANVVLARPGRQPHARARSLGALPRPSALWPPAARALASSGAGSGSSACDPVLFNCTPVQSVSPIWAVPGAEVLAHGGFAVLWSQWRRR